MRRAWGMFHAKECDTDNWVYHWKVRVRKTIAAMLDRYFAWTVGAILAVSAVAIVWKLQVMSHDFVQRTAIRDASAYSSAIEEFRTLYASEVVMRVKPLGIQVSHDYADHPNAIPLPATLSKALGDRLGHGDAKAGTRLYSRHPFPWTHRSGPQDDFEWEALLALEANPDQPFHRIETANGESYLRYAVADVMRDSCIDCHNTHPDSPKTDWKTGDVRGVLSTRVSLNEAIAHTRSEVHGILWILGLASASVIVVFSMMIYHLRYRANLMSLANEELQFKSKELKATSRLLEDSHDDLRVKACFLEQSRRAAWNLMQDMKQARDAAEAATRAKSEFLANMSHEIRTPMTSILGFSEIVMGHVHDEASVEAIATIQRNGHYLLDIINDILDLSQIESEKLEVECMQCSPVRLLTDVVSLMRVRAKAKGLSLELDYDGPMAEFIQSDPTRLRQILFNLTSNAIKFTATGTIRLVARMVDIESPRPKLQVDVIDTGIGISEDETASLFQAFSQVDTSLTRKFGGTGLGLTISKRIAQMLGGDVTVQSIVDQGSTFRVTVDAGPLLGVSMLDDPNAIDAEPARVATPGMTDLDLDCRVLLAEDGPDNQRLISFLLSKAGADVTIAMNGQIAFEMASQADRDGTPFDVILMDMQMPVLDGYSATRQLREADYVGPIVALTAHAMSSDRRKCFEAGCDDYIMKPINRAQLIAKVAKHARHSQLSEVN